MILLHRVNELRTRHDRAVERMASSRRARDLQSRRVDHQNRSFMNQSLSLVALRFQGFYHCFGVFFFQISSMSKYGLFDLNGSMAPFCCLDLRWSIWFFKLVMQENKKDLFLFWHLVHRVRIFTVTLQIYLGTLGIFGLSGGIFSNSWERGINDRYNNTAKACFFLNFILVWIVKPNRSVIVLGMVVEDITFLVTEWYEQMIELFGFLYIVVTTMEMHYTDIKVRLRVEDLTTKFNIIAWLGNFDVASLKCIIFSLKAVFFLLEISGGFGVYGY